MEGIGSPYNDVGFVSTENGIDEVIEGTPIQSVENTRKFGELVNLVVIELTNANFLTGISHFLLACWRLGNY